MSLYRDYVLERRAPNGGVVEDEYGFATYFIFNKECYIDDVYVVPEKRGEAQSRRYEGMIIGEVKDRCNVLTGTVDVTANGAGLSLALMVRAGYTPFMTANNLVHFKKEF